MAKTRLEEKYLSVIRPGLQKSLGINNVMAVPKITKIVVNVGVRDAVSDSKAVQAAFDCVARITGQRPVKTVARKSIAGFKLREGMPIGVKVTLRGQTMYEFFDRLITLALPAIRDFQGVGRGFDHQGNYNLGIKEWVIFPEVDYETSHKVYGMNITVHTTALTDQAGEALLKEFGMPFKKA